MEPLGLPERVDLAFTKRHHLLRHVVDLRAWPVVHHRIGEHKVNIALELERVRDQPVLDARLDRLQVHGPLDDVVVVGSLRLFDRVVEDVPVAMLGDLRVQHADHVLESLVTGAALLAPCLWGS